MADIWVIVRKCVSSVEDIGKVVAGEIGPSVRILLRARAKSFALPFEADTKALSANREAVRITSFALIWLQSLEWRSQALSNADKASLRFSSAVALITERPVKFIDFTVQKGCQLQRLAILSL